MDSLAKSFRKIRKMSPWSMILIFLVVTCLFLYLNGSFTKSAITEGFVQSEQFVVKRGIDALDDFYVGLYDDILFSQVKNDYEIGEIVNTIKPTSQSVILDIGSGTGHHAGALKKMGAKVTGIDLSPAMVKQAKENYPEVNFSIGDATSAMTFSPATFTDILCLYFTIYQIKDKALFLKNAYEWLMPGGTLVLHLVDRSKFDPIVPAASSLMMVSPQKHAKDRITTSKVIFDTMEYKAAFEDKLDQDVAVFRETFKNTESGQTRQNEHTLHMPTQQSIINIAKSTGFIMIGVADMTKVGYEYQYIYFLQKPQ